MLEGKQCYPKERKRLNKVKRTGNAAYKVQGF